MMLTTMESMYVQLKYGREIRANGNHLNGVLLSNNLPYRKEEDFGLGRCQENIELHIQISLTVRPSVR